MGGMVKAIELGFPQREIADSAYWYQRAVDKKEKIIVGVNAFEMKHEPIPLLCIDEAVARQQLARLKHIRSSRNQARVKRSLAELKKAAADGHNLKTYLLTCVKAYASLEEIMDSLKKIFGDYQEPIMF